MSASSSKKLFVFLSVGFGLFFLGLLWFQASVISEAQVVPRSVNFNHNGEQMTLTRILAADRTADTGTKACFKLTGSNGQPMVCKNNVESFPYLGNKGCKQFYPGFSEQVSTYPGHGAHGGNYDLICLTNSSLGDNAACSSMPVNTCTTCPQCAKNLDCNESLASPGNFSDGAIVRCFDGPDPLPLPEPAPVSSGAGTTSGVQTIIPPTIDSTVVDGVFLTEVKGGDTGNSACAKFNKLCVGPSSFNREACLDFYPHATSRNATVGPQTEHFCAAGSTVGVCSGTLTDTCLLAVSSSQQVSCESAATNVSSFFVECEDPFSPLILQEVGGSLPALSAPVPRNDGSGYVDYTVTIHHPQQVPTSVRVEYSTDGGQTYSQATILSAEPSEGTVDVKNNVLYQMGSTDAVDTDVYDSVVLDFVWDAAGDGAMGNVLLRITVRDASQNTVVDETESFYLDEPSYGAAPEEEPVVDFSLEEAGSPMTEEESGATGRAPSDDVALRDCFSGTDGGETPCGLNEEIILFLDALVTQSVVDADWSEKDRAKAEFIQRYLSLSRGTLSYQSALGLFDHGMTRGEAVEIIVFILTSHGVIFENGGLPLEYSDVSRDHPYGQAIAYATAYGIVEGYPDGSFRPDRAPNLAEVARMVVRSGSLLRGLVKERYAQEVLTAGESDWFVPYIKTVQGFGLSMPGDYQGLGVTVSGLRFLDLLYDFLKAAGLSQPFSSSL